MNRHEIRAKSIRLAGEALGVEPLTPTQDAHAVRILDEYLDMRQMGRAAGATTLVDVVTVALRIADRFPLDR